MNHRHPTPHENEFRPRIKPKAPASLKQNVLEAVRKEAEKTTAAPTREGELPLLSAHRDPPRLRKKLGAGSWRMHLAAAVLLLGIMTFALRLRTSTEKPASTNVVASTGRRSGTAMAARGEGLPHQTTAATSTLRPAEGDLGGRDKKASVSSSASQVALATGTSVPPLPVITTAAAPSSPEEGERKQRDLTATATAGQALATSTESQCTANTEEGAPASLPTAGESQKRPEGPEGAFAEQHLLANLEKHRDLVNACLADELAQASHAQQQVSQVLLKYLQDDLNLQQRIGRQIANGLDNLPHGNTPTPKEV